MDDVVGNSLAECELIYVVESLKQPEGRIFLDGQKVLHAWNVLTMDKQKDNL